MLIQEKKREKIAHCSWITCFVVLIINLYLIYSINTIKNIFYIDYLVSVPEHLQSWKKNLNIV